jgi:pimeloyl-ACP methyl ester carboxylesterase
MAVVRASGAAQRCGVETSRIQNDGRQQKAIMSRPDSRSSLGAIHCPTLVLVGNEDALTPVSAARKIADGIVGAKLDIVQDCGHLSTMDRPIAVT